MYIKGKILCESKYKQFMRERIKSDELCGISNIGGATKQDLCRAERTGSLMILRLAV